MSLPSGYTRLEYIESTGTQYIDTGFKPNNNTRVVMDITPVSVDGTHFFGSRSSNAASDYFLFLCTGGHYRDDYAADKLVTTIIPSGRVIIDKNKNSITIGGTTYTHTAASFTGAYPIALLASNTGGSTAYFTKAKLYSCRIYSNGTIVRDFIPCKNASGAVGMWDDANSRFYANAGSGAFTAGPAYLGNHKALVNGTVYEVKGGKCLVNGTAYSIKKGRTLIGGTGYDITFKPPYDPVFANNTWEQIIAACHNNEVPDTWKAKDHKPMTIEGVNYQIDIIGKNHDTYASGGKAPLTFQLHDCYGELKNMNSSDTNRGGWTSCAMRSTRLPAILALMPTEVQNGIREVNKLTSAGNLSATINTTADKLFLLSEIEIFGSVILSRSGEGTQYDYYKAGGGRVKYLRGDTVNWWGRSPTASNYASFCYASSDGSAIFGYATSGAGVSFGFCF